MEWTDGQTDGRMDDAKTISLRLRRGIISGTLIIIVNSYNLDLIAISLRLIKMSINRPGCGL